MRVDIIVPFWNKVDLTKQCVDSILNTTKGIHYKIILIDDGSDDKEAVKKLFSEYENNGCVECVYAGEHLGFARVNNLGFKRTTAEYVMMLNNDTIIQDPKWLMTMVNHFSGRPEIGAVGATSNFVSGKQHVRFNFGHLEEEQNFLIGFCLLIKREVIDKIGVFLDEKFNTHGSDDLDLSIRIKDAGYELKIARDVFVYHIGEQTQKDMTEYKNSVDYYKIGLDRLKKKWGDEKLKKTLEYNPSVLIAVPTMGQMNSKFVIDLVSCEKPMSSGVIFPTRVVVHLARNKVVQEMYRRNAEWIMWIDDDMLFPKNGIKHLMSLNRDITCGMFFRRAEPFDPCVSMFVEKERSYFPIQPKQGIVKVDGCGMAFTLVHRRVYDKLKDPWYHWGEFGEDLQFCYDAKQKGFEIFCDSNMIIRHLGEQIEVDDKTWTDYNMKKGGDKNGNKSNTVCTG